MNPTNMWKLTVLRCGTEKSFTERQIQTRLIEVFERGTKNVTKELSWARERFLQKCRRRCMLLLWNFYAPLIRRSVMWTPKYKLLFLVDHNFDRNTTHIIEISHMLRHYSKYTGNKARYLSDLGKPNEWQVKTHVVSYLRTFCKTTASTSGTEVLLGVRISVWMAKNLLRSGEFDSH